MKRNLFFLLGVLSLLIFSSCARRMPCPAYASSGDSGNAQTEIQIEKAEP